jgi:alanine racemase
MLRIPVEASSAVQAPAWIEIDLAAVQHNVRELLAVLRPGCALIAVCKANAYGHGMVQIAKAALRAGASGLAVANVTEGAELRAAGVQASILVTGPMAPEECAVAVEHRLTPGLGTREQAAALAAVVRPGEPFPVHIEVDTGMRRHGIAAGELRMFVHELRVRGRLALRGVFTHFHALAADEVPAMRAQLSEYEHAMALVRDLGPVQRHAANTLGALQLPASHLDAVRIGGGLYGFDPLRGAGPVRLRAALSLKARILGVREAVAGDAIGYGGAFRCARPTRLGLLPIGYSDGLCRASWTGAPVLVRGRGVPIVGLVSMNQTIVDLTEVPEAGFGDEVVLLGVQGTERVCAEDRVPAGGSTYEVTALLRRDLPRLFRGELL